MKKAKCHFVCKGRLSLLPNPQSIPVNNQTVHVKNVLSIQAVGVGVVGVHCIAVTSAQTLYIEILMM